MALYLCKNSDCTGVITDDNPLQTKHTNQGEPQMARVYLYNDGKRTGIENDTSGMELIYTNINIMIEGLSHTLQAALSPSTSATSMILNSSDGWGIGTILKAGLERMRVEEIVSSTTVRVTRNYTADGGTSILSTHTTGTTITPETSTISLAPVSVDNTNEAGSFLDGGNPLTVFLAPTYLQTAINSSETSNTVVSNDGGMYGEGSIIQIDNEQMKVTAQTGNNLTVIRGYNGTSRTAHQQRAVIYLVGITDTYKAYPFYYRNDPPSGLPTQKKYDVKLVVSTDEEPL